MSGADDDWVAAAMADDAMVVEMLVKLQQTPRRRWRRRRWPALPLEWSVRQRRSKSVSVNHNSSNPKKPAHRASPTTPLSWSGGATSFSGGAGYEECCRSKISSTARSKVSINSKKNSSKRSRKKTLPELKEEEISLMKERRELKRELAAVRKNLETQRATNENLKRMKIELQPCMESTSLAEESTSNLDSAAHHATHTLPPIMTGNDAILESSTSNAHPGENTEAASDSKFVLPDLNIPFDKPCSSFACGVS